MEDFDDYEDSVYSDCDDMEDDGLDSACCRCGNTGKVSSTPSYCPSCYVVTYGTFNGFGVSSGGLRKQLTTASTGSGYGGSGKDKHIRIAGKKEAMKREAKTWKDWQKELTTFLKKKHGVAGEDSSSILNTLKQVLRCQAPEWWWKQPQRKMYITALQVCVVLTKHYPKAWGDPGDQESAVAALEQLAKTSKLLVKQFEKENDKEPTASASKTLAMNRVNESKTDAANWLKQEPKVASKTTNEKDVTLPIGVLRIRDEAVAAVTAVVEAPECSMMNSHDYYRQVLRPLAFDTVEAFEMPRHHYTASGGHGRKPQSHLAIPLREILGGKAKRGKDKSSESSIKSSATVLWKELSTYPTALPIEYGSSIFVRALENEMDKLRVLIIGPDDTPYANGCFLFDVTMGNDYPKAPPKVHFLTTSSFLSASDKKVRFNPNLYDCGKVCLSLLGTWSGPGWSPGESTLLQVLVSLQSLILGTPDPYFNEPGYEGSEGTARGKAASEGYNQTIRKQTLQVAILPFLQNQLQNGDVVNMQAAVSGKRKDPNSEEKTKSIHFAEFKDVIEQHFRLKQQVIRKQLFQWLEKDRSLEALYAAFWNVSDKLDEEARLQSAATSGTSKRQEKRAKVDAPSIKMKDDVILLDVDDDDEDLQQAIVNSMGTAVASKTPKTDGDGVIELADSDDEELNSKPAAVCKISDDSTSREGTETTREAPQEVAPVAASKRIGYGS